MIKIKQNYNDKNLFLKIQMIVHWDRAKMVQLVPMLSMTTIVTVSPDTQERTAAQVGIFCHLETNKI